MIATHPEDYCHRCLGKNLSWWIDSDVWNAIVRAEGRAGWDWSEIICPQCFAELFEERFPGTSWRLSLDERTHGAKEFRGQQPNPERTRLDSLTAGVHASIAVAREMGDDDEEIASRIMGYLAGNNALAGDLQAISIRRASSTMRPEADHG